ncbi:CRISPR-associated endonuclease Cas2 [Fibrobacteria bacterium R8-3-H12]
MKHSHWFVLYDIKNHKRLAQVAKIAERFGVREQYSGFEMNMQENIVEIMLSQFKKVMDENEDFIAILPLCERDYQRIEKYGKNLPIDAVTEPFAIL